MKTTLRKFASNYLLLFGVAGVVLALDQWTKALVRSTLDYGEYWSPWEWLTPLARIVHWRNTGAAFGMGQNLGLLFTMLAIVVSILIIVYYPQIPRQAWPLRIALAMQMGGALGNLLDRLTLGHVTDFISVGRFPVFNVADASISVGAAVLFIGMWLEERRSKTPPAEEEPASISEAGNA
ncbi:MAG: signal peptidase II [Anaerolineae bacterium]|nr:MAG: signal peptidase II [Anaerolineae bacterium]